LGSSAWPGITRTPSCFHFGCGSLISPTSCDPNGSWLGRCEGSLPASGRTGETSGLLGSAEQRLGFVDALLLLRLRIGIGDNAGAGLDIHPAVLDQCGA